MGTSRLSKGASIAKTASPLMVRLDPESKQCLAEAANLRQISVSDYVRAVTVPQARREIRASSKQTIALTPDEQLSFWNALGQMSKMTPSQRRLTSQIRGES